MPLSGSGIKGDVWDTETWARLPGAQVTWKTKEAGDILGTDETPTGHYEILGEEWWAGFEGQTLVPEVVVEGYETTTVVEIEDYQYGIWYEHQDIYMTPEP